MNWILELTVQRLKMQRLPFYNNRQNLASLRTKLNCYKQLVSSNAVSKQEYDDLLGQVNVAEATSFLLQKLK